MTSDASLPTHGRRQLGEAFEEIDESAFCRQLRRVPSSKCERERGSVRQREGVRGSERERERETERKREREREREKERGREREKEWGASSFRESLRHPATPTPGRGVGSDLAILGENPRRE